MKAWTSTGLEIVFWVALFLVVYTYLLYPILLFFAYSLSQMIRDWRFLKMRQDRRPSRQPADLLPPISLIIPAYNEEEHLLEKIANVRNLDYPREKMEVVFISDGSTDRTNDILRDLPDSNIHALFSAVRRGKSTGLNQAVAHSHNDILVFSDASTMFSPDAIKNLVRHFSDPGVGVVCGNLKFEGTSESHHTEGIYWKYETMLRMMEARLGATLTASGAIYALRRQCYCPLSEEIMIDDFVVPMRARKLGYRVVHDLEAIATDFAAPSVAGEFKRRVRLATGSFRALGELLSARLNGLASLALFSHKVLRWILPFSLIALLLSNALLLDSTFYKFTFAMQLTFYVWAGLGFFFRQRMQRIRYGLVGYFLLAMHLAFLVGFVRFLTGHGEGTWQRAN